MDKVETAILREPHDVARCLSEMKLPLDKLLKVRAVAVYEGRNTTPYHCSNAAGTFSYQQGTWALRNELVGKEWAVDRSGGVEAIWNAALKIRVIFANVDIACNDQMQPKPRSKKGAGAERVCMGNLFDDLPHFTKRPTDNEATYYLMVDEKGATELTRPVVSGGTFSNYIHRIYLSDGSDLTDSGLLDDVPNTETFDPQIVRK